MKICNIDIKDYGNDVNGTYDYDSTLQIELYDFDTSKKENVSYSSEVEYREMIIKDYKNDTYIYSPYCKHIKKTYSRLYYENFVSDFFLMCSKPEAIDEFSKELKIKAIIFYHPLFIHLFNNVSLLKKENKRRRTFDLLKKPNKKIIEINENNIKKIEISSVISDYSYRNSRQSLSVESENYIKLYFNKAILIENILEYIKEFNVIINAYFPLGLKSNETYVVTQKGTFLKLTHKLLGDVKYYNKAVYFPIKLNFFEYLEKMYKTMNYRTIENKNFYLPLDFKRPITLEDQFLYYYRYIDMFFGYREKQKGNELRKTHKRIELFLKENLGLFQDVDCGDLELLKNKICSLRNHYLHEGYYLTNDEYTVNDGTKEFNVKLDYMWLYKITQSFKIGTYNILYKDILDVEINESELKICCNNIK